MRSKILLTIVAVAIASIPLHAQQGDYQTHFSLGQDLMRSGKYAEAMHEFDLASRKAGDDKWLKQTAEYNYALSKARSTDAPEELERFLERYPATMYYHEAQFAVAGEYFERGNFDEALIRYRSVDVDRLDEGLRDQYIFKTGYCYFAKGDLERARTMLLKADRKGEYASHLLYCLGYIDYRDGQLDAAKIAFNRLLDDKQYGEVADYYLFQIEYQQGNYRYIVDNTQRVLTRAQGERRKELLRIVAEACFRLEDWAGTSDFTGRYMAVAGNEGREENYMAGFAAYMTGDYSKAESYLVKVCGVDDRLTQNAAYHLGDCYLRKGDKQRAMQSFAMASGRDYDNTLSEDALFNYGKLQFELGGGYFNEAINVLNRYLQQYPQSDRAPQVKELLVASYYNSHDYDAAYQAMSGFRNPDNTMKAAMQKISYFRALEAMDKDDLDSAEQCFAESERYGYNVKYSALTSLWKGELCYRRGDYAAASQYFESYIRLSPENERENMMARYMNAYSWFNAGNTTLAKQWFENFLTKYKAEDSYVADAYNRLGDLDAAARSFWQAIETYRKAEAVGSDERYYAAFRQAVMLGMVDRRDRKIEELNKIISKGEGDYVDDAMYELGRTYMVGEEFDKALKTYEEFVKAYPQSPCYVDALGDLGLVCRNLKRNDDALRYYKAVVDNSYKTPQARSAMDAIKDIYVERNEVGQFFDYADHVGMQTDTGAVERDSLAFVAARNIYLTGDRKRGETALRQYVYANPKGVYVADALYYGAECSSANNNAQAAVEQLKQLSELPNNDFTERGLNRLVDVSRRSGDVKGEADACQKLYGVASDAKGRNTAARGYLNALLTLGDNAVVIAAVDSVLGDASADELTIATARYVKAKALDGEGRSDEALKIFELLSDNVDNIMGVESAYRVVKAAFDAGNLDRAETLVYRASERGPVQCVWLGKMFLVLGDVFVARGNTFQARSTYQSIVDGYSIDNDGIIDQAKAKIKSL